MQHIDLLSSFGKAQDMNEFAAFFFSVLGVENYEERESVSYVDEKYFRADYNDISIKISLSDDEDREDIPCWIQFTSDVLSASELENMVDCIVYNKMLPSGLRVARIFNFGRKDDQRVDY